MPPTRRTNGSPSPQPRPRWEKRASAASRARTLIASGRSSRVPSTETVPLAEACASPRTTHIAQRASGASSAACVRPSTAGVSERERAPAASPRSAERVAFAASEAGQSLESTTYFSLPVSLSFRTRAVGARRTCGAPRSRSSIRAPSSSPTRPRPFRVAWRGAPWIAASPTDVGNRGCASQGRGSAFRPRPARGPGESLRHIHAHERAITLYSPRPRRE